LCSILWIAVVIILAKRTFLLHMLLLSSGVNQLYYCYLSCCIKYCTYCQRDAIWNWSCSWWDKTTLDFANIDKWVQKCTRNEIWLLVSISARKLMNRVCHNPHASLVFFERHRSLYGVSVGARGNGQ
jgi:hypothetical protein